ncbi:hypothetical protein, partial [Roseateles koreensis]
MSLSRPNQPSYSAAELGARIRSQLSKLAEQGLGATGPSNQAQVGLELGPDHPLLHITHWHYRQTLHEPWRLDLRASGGNIPDLSTLLMQRASFWQRDGVLGFHALSGLI